MLRVTLILAMLTAAGGVEGLRAAQGTDDGILLGNETGGPAPTGSGQINTAVQPSPGTASTGAQIGPLGVAPANAAAPIVPAAPQTGIGVSPGTVGTTSVGSSAPSLPVNGTLVPGLNTFNIPPTPIFPAVPQTGIGTYSPGTVGTTSVGTAAPSAPAPTVPSR